VLSDPQGIKLNDFFYAVYSCGGLGITPDHVPMTDWIDTAPQDWIRNMSSTLHIAVLPAMLRDYVAELSDDE
jgi:hypothetical protein